MVNLTEQSFTFRRFNLHNSLSINDLRAARGRDLRNSLKMNHLHKLGEIVTH